MANLKSIEKRFFEDIFDMKTGYVMDFTNITFAELFKDTVDIDIYDDKYAHIGDSKAKRLRTFWEIESNKIVGTVLKELLENWKYIQEKKGKKIEPYYTRGLNIVYNLLGEEGYNGSTENEFPRKDFTINLSQLNLETNIFKIINQRISEIEICLKNNAPLSVIFLCGSVLEGLLLNFANKYPQKFNTAKSAPKSKDGKVKKFQEWHLKNFIDVACEIGFIGLDIKKHGHSLRDFRNYIHPYQQLNSDFTPDKHTAEINWKVLKAAIADLSKIKDKHYE